MSQQIKKSIERETRATDHRGKVLIARIATDGVYMKLKGQRWDSAVFMPWQGIYDYSCVRQAREDKREKQLQKEAKRMGIAA